MERGYILQPTYRIENGKPIVHLFGVMEDGDSFVFRDTRVRPSFFIRSTDLSRAEDYLAQAGRVYSDRIDTTSEPDSGSVPAEEEDRPCFPKIGTSSWQTMDGAEATEIFVPLPADVVPLRENLWRAGIECLEADVPFTTSYLTERSIRSAIEFDSPFRSGRLIKRIYEDVTLKPGEFEPKLSILALDIETNPAMDRVLSFSLYGLLPHGGRVAEAHYVIDPAHSDKPVTIETKHGSGLCHEHRDEAALLWAFKRRIREIDPDVLTGWNVIGFDLKVLETAFAKFNIPFYIGRADLPCRVMQGSESWMTARATVFGRVVVDGLNLVRGSFIKLDSYTLEAAAQTILGEGKLVTSSVDKAAEIMRLYREELDRFLEYNLTDSRLVIEIIEELKLIPLVLRRSLITGLPIDRVGGSIASFDFLYLRHLRKAGIVAPSVMQETQSPLQSEAEQTLGLSDAESTTTSTSGTEAREQPAAIGGTVLDSVPGIYDNVWLFDYRSLYPSIIRTFEIDPLGYQLALQSDEADTIEAPNGARFARQKGILPQILGELFPLREAAKERGEAVVQTAIKILMNSFYGVLATPRCRFFSTQVSNGITSFGREILLWTQARFEEMGYRVIYGDTDSVFVVSGIFSPREASDTGEQTVARLNDELAAWVKENYGVDSRLELEFERLYLKFFLPTHRHSKEGSKKRYAGLIETSDGSELVFTGLESVRRDWTVLAKDFQRHLLMRVFTGREVEPFVKEFIRQLQSGERDGDLVYRKALRKPLSEYGKTTPPHVKAARLIPGKPGRVISYLITTEGPQPVGYVTGALDYDHYLKKQIRPIAESILGFSDISFDEILGKGSQLGFL